MAWSAVLGFVLAIPPALFVVALAELCPTSRCSRAMGVLGTITQACYIKGMAEGDAAAMAPIDYTRLVFAVILGYALFGDIPNAMTMLGAGIVIGLHPLHHTARGARSASRKPPARRSA